MKPPGKRPDEANFSLYSTDKGIKSTSSFATFAVTTVASNIVFPNLRTTDPLACFASLPVSRTMDLPSPKSITFSNTLNILLCNDLIYSSTFLSI